MKGPPRLLRDWWPVLVIVLLAITSVEVLYSSFRRWQGTLEEAVASVDSLARARQRVTRAYLGLARLGAGDATFTAGLPAAELATAADALDDWLHGRSAVLGVAGEPPADPALIALGRAYRRELNAFGGAVASHQVDVVEARSLFSAAESAANALEGAVYERLRERIADEKRMFHIRLWVWSAFLLLGGVGVSVGRNRMRAAELATARSDARLGELRGLAPLGIVECGASGSVRAANRWWCDTTGEPERRWRGRAWWEGLPEEERAEARERWDRAVEANAPGSGDFRLEPAGTATPRWVIVRWAPSRLETPDGESWVVTFTDISERREVEEQLRQAQKMELMGQLTGSIAHDFNNLLTIMVINVQLLKDVVALEPEDAPILEDLERAAAGGAALVRGLLQFSRRSELQLRPLDLGETVRENARLVERLLPRSVGLRILVEEGVPVVRADAGALQQVLLNLATNARDAMPEGGTLTLRVRPVTIRDGHPGGLRPGPHAELLVSDTGVGMTEETRERIFQPFFTTKRPGEGTGLGLPSVLALVQRQDGHLEVESEPGKGTTFAILLPGSKAPAALPEPRQPSAAPADSRGGPILLVEEDRRLREAMRRILERAGYAVLEADTGADAARVVRETGVTPAVVVAHLVMPHMSGLELYRALGVAGDPPPFVLTSGHAEGTTRPMEIPVNALYLAKPWTAEQLVDAVARAGSRGRGAAE